MPTGYTDMIDRNPKMTAKQWIMEGIARAFGVCVTLRDEPMDLTEEQIKERIAKDGHGDVAWHQMELAKAIQEKAEIEKRTPQEWRKAWRKSEAEKVKGNIESTARAEKMATRHNKIREELELLANSEVDEFTKTVAKYGLNQLEIVKDETEPYINAPVTLKFFKIETIRSNTRDIAYHTKEMAEAKLRADDRVQAYMTLRKDVDTVLGGK